jgi:hypothetical protein
MLVFKVTQTGVSMSKEQDKNTPFQHTFYNKSVLLINRHYDNELLTKSFFTSKKSIERSRLLELQDLQQNLESLQKKSMIVPIIDIATGRAGTYQASVKIINDHFDKKLLKKSLFSSTIAIQMARKIELEKIENKFFNKQLRS